MAMKLTPRLAAALPYVRSGRRLADVGTDHAYLPIHIVKARLAEAAQNARDDLSIVIASDINQGPVARAKAHIAAEGLDASIRTVCTPGLDGLDAYDPEDIIIFGMGGELIVSILAAAPWVRHAGKRLILQPMTHAEKLRAYLFEAGFSLVGETLAREDERVYQIICAEPTAVDSTGAVASTGTVSAPHGAVLWVGDVSHYREDPEQMAAYRLLLQKFISSEGAARDARRAAGQDTRAADDLLRSLEAALAQAQR